MITTVTPNPSLDRTVAVPALVRAAVLRATGAGAEPSGKGVNVALALARQGWAAAAVLPVGGPTGALVLQLLTAEAAGLPLALHAVPVAGDVRTNTSLSEPDGTVTKVNEPGPHLGPAEVAALLTAVDAAHPRADEDGADWVATCGSLPPGAPPDLHARVVARARARGLRTAVDSSGAALLAALAAGPDLAKPNAEELAEATGRGLRTLGDVIRAAQELRDAGAGAVLASLGGDGAVLVDADGALHATAEVPRVLSTVGAGDALLAGYLAGTGEPRERLLEALRWGAAAVGSATTLFTLPPPGPGGAARCGAPDRERPLREPVQPASG